MTREGVKLCEGLKLCEVHVNTRVLRNEGQHNIGLKVVVVEIVI